MPGPSDHAAIGSRLVREGAGLATLAFVLALSGTPARAQQADPASPAASSSDAGRSDARGADAGKPDENDTLKAGQLAVPAPPADAVMPDVKPVISDDEFNRSIPRLGAEDDPELGKPLETIDEFEKLSLIHI